MRRFFTALFCLLASAGIASAQTEAGRWVINPASELSFSTNNPFSDNTYRNIVLQIGAGHFVADNFLARVSCGYEYQKMGDTKDRYWNFGVGGRYYINGVIPIGLTVEHYISRIKVPGAPASSQPFPAVSVEAGYAWFVAPNLSIEPLVYCKQFYGSGRHHTERIGLSIGLNIYL
ncbi:MAG: hypothetical protein AB7C90_01900 [Bacteroidales bacterium]